VGLKKKERRKKMNAGVSAPSAALGAPEMIEWVGGV
jgi:hypothetical protein